MIKKVIILMFVMLLIGIPLASAFQFDNTKQFNKDVGKYGKITLKNYFGLGKTLQELELKENTFQCSLGIYCSAEIEIIMEEEGVVVEGLRFKKNSKTGKDRSIKNYKLFINGQPYQIGEVKPAGTYILRLEGEKHYTQVIDWQFKTHGKWLDDWALWGATSGPIIYYSFNETSGTNLPDVSNFDSNGTLTDMDPNEDWVPGIIGNALKFNRTDGYVNVIETPTFNVSTVGLSISVWLNVTFIGGNQFVFDAKNTGPDNDGYSVVLNSSGFINYVQKGGASTKIIGSTSIVKLDSWVHYVSIWNGTDISIYFNGTLENTNSFTAFESGISNFDLGRAGDDSDYYNGSIDEFGIWNRTLTATEVSDLYNDGVGRSFGNNTLSITLDSPTFNQKIIANLTSTTHNQRFEVTANSDGVNDLKNFSLFLNGVKNTSFNISGSTNFTAFNIELDLSFYNVTLEVCDDIDVCRPGNNITFEITGHNFTNESFSVSTTESNVETFTLNVSTSIGRQVSQANLIYNNTVNVGTITDLGNNNFSFSKQLQIPNVDVETNLSFFWNIIFNDGGSGNTTVKNQTINSISVDNCSTFTTLILNYSMFNEETKSFLDAGNENTSIEIDVDISPLGSTTPLINFSETYNQTNPAQVCLSINLTENVNFRMDVETRYVGTNYVPEFHNIQNFTLANSSIPQNINLFGLLTNDNTNFLITFKDISFLPVEDALIDIQRKYVGDGIFRSVEIPKTDSSGQAVGHFDTDGVIYTIIVSKNGVILATFENIAVICEDAVIGDCKINLNAFQTGEAFYDFQNAGGLDFVTSFNNRTISTTFTTTSGGSSVVSIKTRKFDRFGNTTVCVDNLTSSSGTLTCVIPDSFGNVTVITQLFKDGNIISTRTFSITPNPRDTFGGTGIVLVIILVMTLPFMFISDKVGFMVAMLIGLVMGGALSLYETGGLIGPTSFIMWLILAVGLGIWKMTSKENLV